MAGLFDFTPEEIFSCFAVLTRYSVIFAVLPIFGERSVPGPVKILLALSITFALFPGLVRSGVVRPADAAIWAATTGGIVSTIGLEVLVGLVLGFTARLVFDTINFAANLTGNFMGFSMASTYDPHQESQTLVVAEIQIALATIAFLALDGHHLMLRAALESYSICGIGMASFNQVFQSRLIDLTGQVIQFGIQMAAPVAVVLFGVNVGVGVFSRGLPQVNLLALTLSITAFVGLGVLFLTQGEFQIVASNVMGRAGDWMSGVLLAFAEK